MNSSSEAPVVGVNNSPCDISQYDPSKDSDGDGVTDDCEALAGTNPNAVDSNNNGINDLMDVPPNQMSPQDQYALDNYRYQQLADALGLGSAATSGQAPSGATVAVQRKMAFGPLENIGTSTFNPAAKDHCNQPETIFLGFYGTYDGRPAELELCGLLDRTIPNSTSSIPAVLDGASIVEWTWAYAKTQKFTGPFNEASLRGAQVNQTFKVLTASSRIDGCVDYPIQNLCSNNVHQYMYTRLELSLETTTTIKFMNVDGKYDQKVETKTFQGLYGRVANPSFASFSQGFLGFWLGASQ